MKASEWIDRLKVAKGWSDYRVAKELGFTPSTISMYRSNGGPMDENIAIKVAHALGEKPEVVMLDQYAERTKNPEIRTAIFDVSRRLSIVSKTAMVAIVVVALYPMDSSASTVLTAASSESASYYVKSKVKLITDGAILRFFTHILSIFTGKRPFRLAA